MRLLLFKLPLTLTFGLGLTIALLGLMTHLSAGVRIAHAADRTVCLAGPPTCTYTNVQAAVDAAAPGDVIKVAAGTYTGVSTRSYPVFGNPTRTFTQMVFITKSVSIRGGYTTDFTEPPNPQTNLTTLDAQGQGRVIFLYGANSTIEGLRLMRGDATRGGNLFNGSRYDGGGLLISNVNGSVISGNTVINNKADYGGGILISSAISTLTGNIIQNNSALIIGGGVGAVSMSVTLDNNQIVSNTAAFGGGIGLFAGGNGSFNGNLVAFNTAMTSGGGLFLHVFGTLEDRDNNNNIIANNQANVTGSGLYIESGLFPLVHATISDNKGGDGSGLYVAEYLGLPSRIGLTNTIIVSQTVGITVAAGNTVTLESTLWNGNATDWAGAGTINTNNNYRGDPAFGNPAGGDYHLNPNSAAIDKGINAGVTHDIDGEARPEGIAPDLGADEYRAAPLLTISKSGPSTATAGALITYTLTITNSGDLTATNLVITDVIPVGANYVSGGTKVGNVVSWTLPSLAANGGVAQTSFVVTATQTITNSNYGVRADSGYSAQGNTLVVTIPGEAEGAKKIFLPLILKQ